MVLPFKITRFVFSYGMSGKKDDVEKDKAIEGEVYIEISAHVVCLWLQLWCLVREREWKMLKLDKGD
ncbi:unnamed protein product [Urochloa humidicola]